LKKYLSYQLRDKSEILAQASPLLALGRDRPSTNRQARGVAQSEHTYFPEFTPSLP